MHGTRGMASLKKAAGGWPFTKLSGCFTGQTASKIQQREGPSHINTQISEFTSLLFVVFYYFFFSLCLCEVKYFVVVVGFLLAIH